VSDRERKKKKNTMLIEEKTAKDKKKIGVKKFYGPKIQFKKIYSPKKIYSEFFFCDFMNFIQFIKNFITF
jgi:hypothetical protein